VDGQNRLSDRYEIKGNRVFMDGRMLGWFTRIDGRRVYVSPRQELPHKMRIYRGWGVSKELLEWLKEEGFEEVQLRVGKARVLSTTVQHYLDKGIPDQYQTFEVQLFLAESGNFKEHKLTIGQILG